MRAALRAQAMTVRPPAALVVSATAPAKSSGIGSMGTNAEVGHTATQAPQATHAPASMFSSFFSMVMASAKHASTHLQQEEWRLRTATQNVGIVMMAFVSRASIISMISFKFGMARTPFCYSPR